MAYASRVGRARVSSKNPQALAICDRCGFTYNHVDLAWQFDWGGASLINKRILVCQPCNDTPQNQLRAIVLPADPTPIMNPRTENFAEAETDYVTVNAPTVTDFWTGIPIPPTTTIIAENGANLTNQPIGLPQGLYQNAVMPQYDKTLYRVKLYPLSVLANGTNTITVTCSAAHGLSTDSQIAIEGLSNNNADGFYSVTVGASATAFTYQTNNVIPSGNILQSSTLLVTALVGLPYNYTQIPQTGV